MCWIIFWWKVKNTTCIRKRLKRNLTFVLLEEEELIVRVPDEEDGRLKKIVFTEKAKAIRSALRSEIKQSEEVLLRGISREEQAVFMKITAKMLENLEEEEKRNE